SHLGLTVDARIADLETAEPLPFDEASFDLICIILFLHRPLYSEARRVLRPGGRLIAVVHIVDEHDEPPVNPAFLMQPGELAATFADWPMLIGREGPSREETHTRAVAEIVVQKPP